LDLRERVAAAVVSGQPCRKVAATFGVSVASAVKWSQRLRETGSAAAKPMGGKRPRKLADEVDWLLSRVNSEDETVTCRSLALELQERGIDVSHHAVWLQLRRSGYSFKKNTIRGRAKAPQGRQSTRAVETASGEA